MGNEDKIDLKIDFIRYALHEIMLPHQLDRDELICRCNRVTYTAQTILNIYGLPQEKPKELRLYQDESYYLAEKEVEIKRLNKIINRYEKFFKFLRWISLAR